MIKKGTQVKVITGKDKGKTGEVLEINRKLNTVKIKSINKSEFEHSEVSFLRWRRGGSW